MVPQNRETGGIGAGVCTRYHLPLRRHGEPGNSEVVLADLGAFVPTHTTQDTASAAIVAGAGSLSENSGVPNQYRHTPSLTY